VRGGRTLRHPPLTLPSPRTRGEGSSVGIVICVEASVPACSLAPPRGERVGLRGGRSLRHPFPSPCPLPVHGARVLQWVSHLRRSIRSSVLSRPACGERVGVRGGRSLRHPFPSPCPLPVHGARVLQWVSSLASKHPFQRAPSPRPAGRGFFSGYRRLRRSIRSSVLPRPAPRGEGWGEGRQVIASPFPLTLPSPRTRGEGSSVGIVICVEASIPACSLAPPGGERVGVRGGQVASSRSASAASTAFAAMGPWHYLKPAHPDCAGSGRARRGAAPGATDVASAFA
jgi:hypothetical protein